MTDIDTTAKAFKELGHPTRLRILKLLVKAGPKGLAVGDIQQQLGIPSSTLSHHLSALGSVDLIQQHRAGRTLYCLPQFPVIAETGNYLMAECCVAETKPVKSDNV